MSLCANANPKSADLEPEQSHRIISMTPLTFKSLRLSVDTGEDNFWPRWFHLKTNNLHETEGN